MTKINTVFVVDDDPITVFGLKKMLTDIGTAQEIQTFANGKLALDRIVELQADGADLPEVILLDINMPIMDGWQFLDAFLGLPIKETIRINIITSSIDPYDRQQFLFFKGRTHHQLDFRNKPIRRADLEAITRAA